MLTLVIAIVISLVVGALLGPKILDLIKGIPAHVRDELTILENAISAKLKGQPTPVAVPAAASKVVAVVAATPPPAA